MSFALWVLYTNIHLSFLVLSYPASNFMIVVVELLNLFFFLHYNVALGALTQRSGPLG